MEGANVATIFKRDRKRKGAPWYIDYFDVLAALAGVELVLQQMGYRVKPGVGVAAAQQAWAS